MIEALDELDEQKRINLRDWLEKKGALRDGARIAWASVTWTVCSTPKGIPCAIVNDETEDRILLSVASSLPSAGWRVLQ